MIWRIVRCMVLFGFVWLAGGPVFAQNAKDPKKWSDEFIDQVITNGAPAFEEAIRRTIIGELMSQSVDDLTRQLREAARQFGPAISSEYIGERKLGSRLRELNYAVYHTRMFLFYRLAFYKANNGWQLFGITFTTRVEQLPWE